MVALRFAGANTLEQAREQAEEVLKLGPQFSLENEKRLTAFKDPRIGEHRLATLRTAGLK
jgi:hypothetical protein